MKIFKVPIILIALLMAVMAGITIYFWIELDKVIPAPPITNNAVLNEKLNFIKKMNRKNFEVIAIGSSMTANNIHTVPLKEALQPDSYVNIGAYGLKIAEVEQLCLLITDIYKVKKILINSNMMDFYYNKDALDIMEYRGWLTSAKGIITYLKYWNPRYMYRFLKSYNPNRNTRNAYQSVMFDESAGIPLEIYGEDISQERFNTMPNFNALDEYQYQALRNLLNEMLERNVEVIFVQSPYREGILEKTDLAELDKHFERVRDIVEDSGQRFIMGADRAWPDSLYCDYSHFNAKGSYQYTQYIMNKFYQGD